MTSTNRQQADSRTFTRAIKLVGLALAGICVTGCPSPGLPSSVTFSEAESVTVGDGVSVEVALGAGAPSLADSTWAIHKASDDSLLFRIVFGSNGEAERLFDSSPASGWGLILSQTRKPIRPPFRVGATFPAHTRLSRTATSACSALCMAYCLARTLARRRWASPDRSMAIASTERWFAP